MTYSAEVLADSPLLYWRLGDSSSATVANDSSGNSRNGTYTIPRATRGVAGLLAGDADTAISTTVNSGQIVNLGSAVWMNVSTLTVECWVNFSSAADATGDGLVSRWRSASGTNWRLWRNSSGQLAATVRDSDSIATTVSSSSVVATGTTYHVALTASSSTLTLYVNGASVASAAITGGALTTGASAIAVGWFDNDANTNPGATFDEVAVYGTALSGTRIAAHYDAGSGAGTTPEVTASLTGSGAFSATSVKVGVATAMLLGSGAFTATSAVVGAPEVDGNLTGTGVFTAVREVEREVDGNLTGSGAFTADVVAVLVAATDTSNRTGGRSRRAYAVATWDPPVVDPPPTIVHGESRDKANVYGAITMNGTQPVFDVTTISKTRHRDRIIVGGKDITYWRGKPTPLPTYQLVSPLLYGPATLRLPQVAAAFEQVGAGDLSWLQPWKVVKVQRVDPETGEVQATDYKGIVIAFNASGGELTVEIGGEASGRAALMEKQLPIFRSTHDIGQIAAFAMMPLRVPFKPHRGPTTGIRLGRFGGTGWLDYISQLCARAWTRSGNQWTIMPAADGFYQMVRKDTTTIDATAYLDDARTVADLRRDKAEEPNRIFVTGITPDGQRVMFASFPGLQKTRPAPYPFNDNRTFGVGTTDAETDTGDGITVMVKRLNMFGIVAVDDAPGGFDADIAKAIRDLQEDAELPVTGVVNPATWRALYDLDATGYSLRNSEIQPAAQKSYTKPWLRSPSGAIMRRNPNYDAKMRWVDRVIDMGSGFTKDQMREYAVTLLDQSEDNWVGTVTFHTGALVGGSHGHGFAPTDADLFRARRLKPGMNIRLPHSPGGDITVHVSAVSVDEDGKVTATVDTRARDTMSVWEVILRNRESRRDLARQWEKQHRASGQIKDAIDGWWAPGGKLGADITVPAHRWTMVEIVAGQEGTVQAIRVRTNPNAEYVMAVAGKKVSPKRLARLIGNPLTKAGAKKWSDEGVRNQLDRDRFLLYVAGDKEQPLGYYPRDKRPETVITNETNPDYDPSADSDSVGTDDEPTIEVETETGSTTPLTGRWEDAAGFSYRTFAQPVIYAYFYADRDTTIPAGRIMWPQLEAAV